MVSTRTTAGRRRQANVRSRDSTTTECHVLVCVGFGVSYISPLWGACALLGAASLQGTGRRRGLRAEQRLHLEPSRARRLQE
jgi:hypothetical protein